MPRPAKAIITAGGRDFKYLAFVKHTMFSPTGSIDELRCKMCGAVIAGQVERLIGSTTDARGVKTERVQVGFQRFANFCEASIEFEDGGSPHITTGCQKCMDETLQPKHLMELYQADIIDLNESAGAEEAHPPMPEFYKKRIPTRLRKLARYAR